MVLFHRFNGALPYGTRVLVTSPCAFPVGTIGVVTDAASRNVERDEVAVQVEALGDGPASVVSMSFLKVFPHDSEG